MSVVSEILAGDMRAAGRLMRDLDDRQPGATENLRQLYSHTGRARIIGVTGNPGCGKSTLVDSMVGAYRQRGHRVGVVAIDPSSPFSGGAILGDRIRMQRHALDEGVFIRSLASRGHLGGLSRSTGDIVTVLDAMGFDPVLVETVGVGQAEVDIVEAAHLSIVVVVPGLGDEIQAMKAGILEIADILCVNKSDRPGADRAAQDLEGMLALRASGSARPPVMRTVAVTSQGTAELLDQLERLLGERGGTSWDERQLRRARRQLEDLLREGVVAAIAARISTELEDLVGKVARRELDPYTALERTLGQIFTGADQAP